MYVTSAAVEWCLRLSSDEDVEEAASGGATSDGDGIGAAAEGAGGRGAVFVGGGGGGSIACVGKSLLAQATQGGSLPR